MAKVTGIGGIFIRCSDFERTSAWYAEHLGVSLENWGGAQFAYSDDPNPAAYSLLSFFKPDSEYLSPSNLGVMLNLRVDDLDALVLQLREQGVDFIGDPIDEPYGKFAWIMDPEGMKIELWEQPRQALTFQ